VSAGFDGLIDTRTAAGRTTSTGQSALATNASAGAPKSASSGITRSTPTTIAMAVVEARRISDNDPDSR
jgi:hypothetical protein